MDGLLLFEAVRTVVNHENHRILRRLQPENIFRLLFEAAVADSATMAALFFGGSMMNARTVSCCGALLLAACQTVTPPSVAVYVSDGYDRRAQGYDWMAVETVPQADKTLKVAVRSRVDRKKPSCTFDGTAHPLAANHYRIRQNGMTLNLLLRGSDLLIEAEAPAANGGDPTAYYCSGGGSLTGQYRQVEQPDRSQLDDTRFVQSLWWQNFGLFVRQDADGVLHVRSSGLNHEFDERYPLGERRVIGVEVEDMNRDGYPEWLVYMRSERPPYVGEVLAFSVNGGQSVSQMSWLPAGDRPEWQSYYRGGDEFRLQERQLVHRFPEYINGQASGRMHQVVYEVQNGEAARQLVPVGFSVVDENGGQTR